MSDELNKIVVSSANCMNFNKCEQFFMSFMNIRNRRGPSVEPCGTPMLTVLCQNYAYLHIQSIFFELKNSSESPKIYL